MSAERKTVTRLDSNYVQQYDAYIERQNRKKQRLIRRLVLSTIVTVLIIGFMGVYHWNQRALHAEKTEKYEQLQSELAGLQQEEAQLLEEIELLNDEDYVLDIARTNYFFTKKGELIFKLPNEDPSY
ncbi:FtsB family cell division protein [Oceanobacillus alkalisoli]|uniref:FtsB family cell division protein n=1 Tax=Oceanobacillus alkalisoli TaxID=2925113 RepID=UPI001EEFA06E|nr:septum formation initiator family protein [Oceanobacillus alkalisoli]MCF3944460.1 septum formation initiator family protein [Oceanobacillus alkalisoli]MCG5105126.1 septum formation initiator family protein [Oceanobacillus alkalisoli]